MNCLTPDQLTLLLLGHGQPGWQAHTVACVGCAARREELARSLRTLHDTHDLFHRGHDLGRARLMSALAVEHASTSLQRRRKDFSMRRFWLVTAAALILGLGLGGIAGPFTPALAETARALRDVKTYRCTVTSKDVEDAKKGEAMRLHWHHTAGVRLETWEKDKLIESFVAPRGKPGLRIDHVNKSYRHEAPDKGELEAVLAMGQLAQYSRRADRTLPPERIAGVPTQGFEINTKKVHADLFDGTLGVWIDPATKLPVRVQVSYELFGRKNTLQLDDFAWDVPSDGWFDLTIPAGYTEDKVGK